VNIKEAMRCAVKATYNKLYPEIPVDLGITVGDCLLAMQMGYGVEVNNGKVTAIKKESRLKRLIQKFI
jgi:hypothetical protein